MKPFSIIAHARVSPDNDPGWADIVAPAEKRRSPRIWQMAYVAVKRLVDSCDSRPHSVIVGTALGALDETACFLKGIFTTGLGSPRNFIASVHNSAGGKISTDFNIYGANLTVCDGTNSLASAIVTADLLSNEDFPVLILIIDEHIELLEKLHPHLSSRCREYLIKDCSEGAVALLCGRDGEKTLPRIRAFGPVPCGDMPPQEICRGLAESNLSEPWTLPDVHDSSASYGAPAQRVDTIITKGETGHHIIGSYSPSTHAAALVELWL